MNRSNFLNLRQGEEKGQIRIRIQIVSWIRIRIKLTLVRNTRRKTFFWLKYGLYLKGGYIMVKK